MKKMFLLVLSLLILGLPKNVAAKQIVPILVYHSIDQYSGTGSKELYVTPENFEKQMTYLRDHGYTLLTFERWQDIKSVPKPIFITLDDGYKNNLHAFSILQKLTNRNFRPTATFFVISDFIGRTNRLTNSDLRMVVNSGLISVQSHTSTHPDLTKENNLKYELKESKEKIQKITGKPVIAIAYPFGNTNEHVVAETKKYYQFGLTTTPGPFSLTGFKNELYYLPRIYIKYSTTLNDFEQAVQIK
ncbi:polysaccharide deacetylase family protein [Bacillus sp. X1(2014)]|uniref:polysaccharide deacetylase family protein n=1 Tax=Bacillus sp. X1(2014) TaxID=1565991 RepID=UPI00119D6D96|nr:polysaccharide deacetylase family protein [Bacillus sp. X1(2014)]